MLQNVDESKLSPEKLRLQAERLWAALWKIYYLPETGLLYDYRTSRDFEHRFDHLPSVREIAECKPNPCGWGSGMEDSMINAGVTMDALTEACLLTSDPELVRRAADIFKGMVNCAEISGVKGFLARSISPRDGRSIYPESSRDQYTNFVHGIWKFYHSPLSDKAQKAKIREIMESICALMEEVITPESDYTIPRIDGVRINSSVCKMWNVEPHEAARLPMIYAAGWDITKNSRWFELYRRYVEDALDQSLSLRLMNYLAYALFQMQCSLDVIYRIEPEAVLREKCKKAMHLAAEYCEFNGWNVLWQESLCDYRAIFADWHTVTDVRVRWCGYRIPNYPSDYADFSRRIRESWEAPLVQLMAPEREISSRQVRLLKRMLAKVEPEEISNITPYGLLAPYYMALNRDSRIFG